MTKTVRHPAYNLRSMGYQTSGRQTIRQADLPTTLHRASSIETGALRANVPVEATTMFVLMTARGGWGGH